MKKWPNVRVVYLNAWMNERFGGHYDNLSAAVQSLGHERVYGGCRNSLYAGWEGFGSYHMQTQDYVFVVYDESGRLIDYHTVRQIADNHAKRRPKRYLWQRNFVFRQGPVEGIRKGRWHRGSVYRHPKTYQEERENEFLAYDDDCIEHNITARKSRMTNALPKYWDDKCKANIRYDNWKKYRKTQWKV